MEALAEWIDVNWAGAIISLLLGAIALMLKFVGGHLLRSLGNINKKIDANAEKFEEYKGGVARNYVQRDYCEREMQRGEAAFGEVRADIKEIHKGMQWIKGHLEINGNGARK